MRSPARWRGDPPQFEHASLPAPWKILHLPVDELPLPTLEPAPDHTALYVVCWASERPLGHFVLPTDQLPLPAHRLTDLVAGAVAPAVGHRHLPAAFEPPRPGLAPESGTSPPGPEVVRRLAALERPLASLPQEPPAPGDLAAGDVSVVICTRNRPESVDRCLGSMKALRPSPAEVLVVDNAPEDDRTEAVVSRHPFARYAREPRPGLSAARNAGIRATSGRIVAFTDDDCVPHLRWIEGLLRGFVDPDVTAVTGLALPDRLETPSELRFERVNSFNLGYRRRRFDGAWLHAQGSRGAHVWGIGAGANMAFRRVAFDRIGLFDLRLGAGTAGCSEDSELWYRVLADGGSVLYEPTAVVFHRHRADPQSLDRQLRQYMRGHVAALLIQAQRHGHPGNLGRLLFWLPGAYARWALGRLLWGPAFSERKILQEVAGCVAGVGYWLRHRSDPDGLRGEP